MTEDPSNQFISSTVIRNTADSRYFDDYPVPEPGICFIQISDFFLMSSIWDGEMTSCAASINNYIIEDEIGRGTSGRVFKARSRTCATQTVAIKFIAKKQLSKAAKDNLINEIRHVKCIWKKNMNTTNNTGNYYYCYCTVQKETLCFYEPEPKGNYSSPTLLISAPPPVLALFRYFYNSWILAFPRN